VNKQAELLGILFLKARTLARNSTFVLDMKGVREVENEGEGREDE